MRNIFLVVFLMPWISVLAQSDAGSGSGVPFYQVKAVSWPPSQDALINFSLERFKSTVIGQYLSNPEVSLAVERATLGLRAEGFLVGQVVLTEKNRRLFWDDGVLRLHVFPGSVGKILINNTSAVDSAWIESVALSALCPEGLGDACVLTKTKFERMTQLLQDIAGVQLGALSFSSKDVSVGQTSLTIGILPKDSRVKGAIGFDNQGFSSTGIYRMGASASVNNLLAVGDVFSFNTFVSNGGSISGSLDLSGPLNYSGLRWQSSLARSQFFVPNVSSSGFGNSLSMGLAYPLVRGLDSNLTVGLNAVDVRTYSETTQIVVSNKTLQAGQLFLEGNSGDRSIYLGQNTWFLRSAVVSGQVADAASTTSPTLGSYTKLSFQGLGKFILSEDKNLYASVNLRGQAANVNLDPYEKMTIGGFSGMRAYSLNQGSFNQGTITSLALHNTIHSDWGRFTPNIFIDYANGWINHSTYSDWQVNSGYSNAQLSNHMVLSDAGLGIDWAGYKDLVLSALWARRLPLSPSGLNNTGNSNSQFWFVLQAFIN